MLSRSLIMSRINRKNGQVIVEMALIVPIILVLMLGIVDFSRAWLLKNNLSEIAREGARFAVLLPDLRPDDDRVEAYCKELLNEQGIIEKGEYAFAVGVELEFNIPSIGEPVKVTIRRKFEALSKTIIPFFKDDIWIHSECVMRFVGS